MVADATSEGLGTRLRLAPHDDYRSSQLRASFLALYIIILTPRGELVLFSPEKISGGLALIVTPGPDRFTSQYKPQLNKQRGLDGKETEHRIG